MSDDEGPRLFWYRRRTKNGQVERDMAVSHVVIIALGYLILMTMLAFIIGVWVGRLTA